MTRPRLPALGLGCAALGNLYTAVTDADAAATLSAAWDQGIRYFDTAPYYGHGLSETRLGRFLSGSEAAGALVSTKVGRSLRASAGEVPDTGFVDAAPFTPYFDYSADAVRQQLDGSLTRLGRESLDLVLVHDIGAQTHGGAHAEIFSAALGGALPALAALRTQGVVGAIGIGVNEVEVCLETLAYADLDFILLAGRYTLLDQTAAAELLPLCQRRGVQVIVGGPYNSGVLAGGDHYDYAAVPSPIVARVSRLRAVCSAHGVSLAAAALHFPLLHPAVVSVVPGARSVAEVTANAAYLREAPPAALWVELRHEGLLPEAAA